MSLAELLPAVQALTRHEKEELVRLMQEELARNGPVESAAPSPLGAECHAGYGLFDEESVRGAAVLYEAMQEQKRAK
jgi:hypothetical protein